MRVVSAHIVNFGSYNGLTFDFSSTGLNLISGPTGSGKSTLCDVIPWILFGRTAKNGAVDEVRTWGVTGDTIGILTINVKGQEYTVSRVRGKDNDLFMCEGKQLIRGKDNTDTQKIINQIIGLSLETYLAGAYFHEFSQTAQFFTMSAKNRRALCEQIVDLSLAKKLQENITKDKKQNKDLLITLNTDASKLLTEKIHCTNNAVTFEAKHKTFVQDNLEINQKLQRELANLAQNVKPQSYYTDDKWAYAQAIKTAQQETCKTCGTPVEQTKIDQLKEELYNIKLLEAENHSKIRQINELKQRIAAASTATNPYSELIEINAKQLMDVVKREETNQLNISTVKTTIADLEVLSDVIDAYRAQVMRGTVQRIESDANDLLSKFFDAEIKVLFSIENAEDIEVEIYKDANLCSYTQLSKGQRCLLKLCFGVAVMRATADRHGVEFNQVFFDESLDGLDDNLKLKAFNLLNSLKYNSIYIVEHSNALKTLFPTNYEVELVNGISRINERTE